MMPPPDAARTGCCDNQRNPCQYHDGYTDGWEAREQWLQAPAALAAIGEAIKYHEHQHEYQSRPLPEVIVEFLCETRLPAPVDEEQQ